MRIIDCFTYTDNIEVIELRIRLLQDVVNKFVIAEADCDYDGVYKGHSLKKKLEDLGIYSEKIEILELSVPPIDQDNNSIVIERMQLNSLSAYIEQDDVAIISDCAEIIRPELVPYYANAAINNPQNLLRIPMYLLVYKANLMAVDQNEKPICITNAFICMKHHVDRYTLSEMRESNSLNSNLESYKSIFLTKDNKVLISGWCFSFIGEEFKEKNGFNLKEFPISELPELLLKNERINSFFIDSSEITLNDILNQNPFLNTDKNSVFFKKFNDQWPWLQYHSYIDNCYEKEFFRFRSKKGVKLLEIGIDTGGSIALWSKYFKDGTVVGIDISDARLEDIYRQSNFDNVVHIFTDAYNQNLSKSLGKFDIIIDDGPHTLQTQIKFINYYLENLNDGGIMIIEDIPEFEWIEHLVSQVDNCLKTQVVDLREIDNRYDSLILIIRK